MNAPAQNNNVVNLPSADLKEIHVRAYAGLRVLCWLSDKLEAELKAKKAEWKEKQTEATKAYREPIREDFEAIVGKEIDLTRKDKATAAMTVAYSKKYLVVVRGVKDHDDT